MRTDSTGQISFFLLFGIILVGISFFFLFSYNPTANIAVDQEVKDASVTQSTSQIVRTFVQECVDQTTQEALEVIGVGAGYYRPVEPFDLIIYQTNYLLYENAPLVPSIEKIESEISAFVLDTLPSCATTTVLSELGLNPQLDEVVVTTTIHNESVEIEVLYPLSVDTGNSQKEFLTFSSILDVRLGHIHSVVSSLVTDLYLDSFLSLSSLNLDRINIYSKPQFSNVILFHLEDYGSSIQSAPYKFIFAIDSESSIVSLPENYAPVIEPFEKLTLSAGATHSVDVQATDREGDAITYSVESPLVRHYSTSSSFVITTREALKGNHVLIVEATDSQGASSYEYLEIDIV